MQYELGTGFQEDKNFAHAYGIRQCPKIHLDEQDMLLCMHLVHALIQLYFWEDYKVGR